MERVKRLKLTASGLILGFFSVFLSACATTGANAPKASATKNADDLMIIDCLLPGQVKQLGAYTTYLTARRPIKTTASDCRIRGGEYVSYDRADYATALKIWLPQAQAGDPEAQTYVGEIYEKGLGLKPDYQIAAMWYQKAAAQGYSRAEINLGNLYEKGLGVVADKAKALNLFRAAAGLKNDKLMYASTETAHAVSQKELTQLKDEVAFKNSQLADARNELKKIRQTMEQHKTSLAKAEEAQKNAKLALYAQESKAIHEQSKELIAQLRTALQKAQTEVTDQRRQLASLNAKFNHYDKQIASTSQSITKDSTLVADASNMPSIEIIDPPMTLTRGLPTIPVSSHDSKKEIVGKIKAPEGIKSFTVNGVKQDVDKYSLFWVTVPLHGKRAHVKLEAVDKNNHKVAFNFTVVPEKLSAAIPDATTRSAKPVPSDLNLGKYYALVIGNNKYQDYPNLKTAVNDAQATAKILHDKYGFTTTVLTNATRYDMLAALNKMRETLKPNDNLLIYYAGHGEVDDQNNRGYWLPVDAKQDDPHSWISNFAISDILNAIKANHILVVADSCYAGTLSVAALPRINDTVPADVEKQWIEAMLQARARMVLTSGGVAPVVDEGANGHSLFANAFLATLKENSGIIDGHAIYRDVLTKVEARANALHVHQIPEYAPAKYAGHEAGEFFFNGRKTG